METLILPCITLHYPALPCFTLHYHSLPLPLCSRSANGFIPLCLNNKMGTFFLTLLVHLWNLICWKWVHDIKIWLIYRSVFWCFFRTVNNGENSKIALALRLLRFLTIFYMNPTAAKNETQRLSVTLQMTLKLDLRDHPFKTLANFDNFWPLPPYHRHSSKMLTGNFLSLCAVTFRPSAYGDTPPPLRNADVLNGWSLTQFTSTSLIMRIDFSRKSGFI